MSNINRKEMREGMPQEYLYTVLKPGGNDTALVRGVIEDPRERKRVNDAIMKRLPNVEQVGFVDLDLSRVRLQMAGNEFCGNATRSTAWMALNGKSGEVTVRVSGTSQLLKAGVDGLGNSWAQMPIYQEKERVKLLPGGMWLVELEGITQIIVPTLKKQNDAETLKSEAYSLLYSLGLTESVAAAGVIYLSENKRSNGKLYEIQPIVYVRDINTGFYETACGSGTTAVGLMLSVVSASSVSANVLQPSGLTIGIKTIFDDNRFVEARISGQVEKLNEGRVTV